MPRGIAVPVDDEDGCHIHAGVATGSIASQASGDLGACPGEASGRRRTGGGEKCCAGGASAGGERTEAAASTELEQPGLPCDIPRTPGAAGPGLPRCGRDSRQGVLPGVSAVAATAAMDTLAP
mmetsp:Transcript_108157/g.316249  ORF Transcript_108157/g.316249 Transcript_108157/m.316249 type:complete len:123 (+) Transcript_108157:275-643(+)